MSVSNQVYKDMVKSLGDDVYMRFCHNIDRLPRASSMTMAPSSPSMAVFNAFVWGITPEGWSYWNDIMEGACVEPVAVKSKKQRYEEVVF